MRIVIFTLVFIPIYCFTQCISGNCENGYGTYKFSSGNTYTGNWMNGVHHGKGSHVWANGDSYSGDFINGLRTGVGIYIWSADGKKFIGEFTNGKIQGLGIVIRPNGTKSEGQFENNNLVQSLSTPYSKPPYTDPNYFQNQFSFGTVKLGTQVWSSENLKVDKFRNGDVIKQARTLEEWNGFIQRKEPAWCYYEFFDFNGDFYGKLYNYYAVFDPRGLAPSGFHVSTSQDWETLLAFLEKEEWFIEENPQYRKKIPAYPLKSKEYWSNNAGVNKYGFGAVPGGLLNGGFQSGKNSGHWWCSDKPKEETRYEVHYGVELSKTYQPIYYYSMFSQDHEIIQQSISFSPYDKENDKVKCGFSVRCVKD